MTSESRPEGSGQPNLAGVRVLELADEQAEYCGLILAGLGADVVKVEPPGGNSTRGIGPFFGDVDSPEKSLFFWHYNRGKRSIVLDLDDGADQGRFRLLARWADVIIDSTRRGFLEDRNLGLASLRNADPSLITARISPFGDAGPWADWKGSDLIHLALGGTMMNCGYDPRPNGSYDLPPIAGQIWQSYHIAGEQVALAVAAALIQRHQTGAGQAISCAIHEAVAKSTEIDLMTWVMRAAPVHRQTCRHASETISWLPTILRTKDGRWVLCQPPNDVRKRTGPPKEILALLDFLGEYGLDGPLRAELDAAAAVPGDTPSAGGRDIPGTSQTSEFTLRCQEALQRLIGKLTYEEVPWRKAQAAGLMFAPLRRPEESIEDDHWITRGTFSDVWHPEQDRSFTYPTSKWVSSENRWLVGRRAPLIGEDQEAVLEGLTETCSPSRSIRLAPRVEPVRSDGRARFPLEGIRIFDFGWFLASAGGTRFLAALGAECIKVEWFAHPDTRLGAMAPVGGREARAAARGPLPPVSDPDMGGQFNNKNSGKRGISLNVRHPKGMEIARELIALSDVVSEGFSPGVMERWGLSYDELRRIRPDIIYAQQSGAGTHGTLGRFRAVGPIAAAYSGISELSGLPEPAPPAGWGYSFLDWIGAYSFGLAIVTALHHRDVTGRGQWIDASQTEAGLFVGSTAFLDWSANGRRSRRTGNRSPYKVAAPHGAYRCSGDDRWLAIACFDEPSWEALCAVAGKPDWLEDARFRTLGDRLRNQDELDAAVSEWTSTVDAREAMAALQSEGVAAGVCQTTAERCDEDPQLAHLGWLTEVVGTKIGRWPVAELPVRMSGSTVTVAGPTNRGAPCYGEDNDYVYGELLGMSSHEIAVLADEGVI